MNITQRVEECIRRIVERHYDEAKKPYLKAKQEKNEKLNLLKEEATKACREVMRKACDNPEQIGISIGTWGSCYRWTKEYDTEEEDNAIRDIDDQIRKTSDIIITKLLLMGNKIDIQAVIDEYFSANPI